MKNNIRIAKDLVRVAKMLLAFSRNELEAQLKKMDIPKLNIQENLDCLEKMSPKEQKAALFWIRKRSLILPEDEDKFKDAMNLIEKQHLDFQDFDRPMDVINRDDKSTVRIKSQDIKFNPDSEPAFKNKKNLGNGVAVYLVDNSKEGQAAVRRAIDANWGYDKNPWCLAARKKNASPGNELNEAWRYWNHYDKYPKRIAFQGRKLIAFSAGDEQGYVVWWDKNDKSHNAFPINGVNDDSDFLMKYGKKNLVEDKNTPVEILEKLMSDKEDPVRYGVAKHPNATPEMLEKMSEDYYYQIRGAVATNKNTPLHVLKKLMSDWDTNVVCFLAMNKNLPLDMLEDLSVHVSSGVRKSVARNPKTPVEILEKLAKDKDAYVRSEAIENPKATDEMLEYAIKNDERNNHSVALNPHAPVDFLRKNATSEDDFMRACVAKNPNTPKDVLEMLSDDKNTSVLESIVRNKIAPVELLVKLSKNSNEFVRCTVAECKRTPVDVLEKLAKDKKEYVRISICYNPNTPMETLKELLNDKNDNVRMSARENIEERTNQ